MREIINKIINFLRKLFWIDRLANVDNYEKNGLLYSFLNFTAKMFYYFYYFIFVLFSILLILSEIPWWTYPLYLLAFPIMYRLIMGFQILFHGIGNEEDFEKTRNNKYLYKFRLKLWYDIIFFILVIFLIVAFGAIAFEFNFTSDNWGIHSDSYLALLVFLGLYYLVKYYLLRTPAIRITTTKIKYLNKFLFQTTVFLKDIKKVSIDDSQFYQRVMIETKTKTFYIITSEIAVEPKELVKAILSARGKKET